MNDDQSTIAVYLRVSTTRQDLRAQEPELRAWVTPTLAINRFPGIAISTLGVRWIAQH